MKAKYKPLTPQCCKGAKETTPLGKEGSDSRVIELRFSSDAIMDERGQGRHTPRWVIDGIPIEYCPFSGRQLPPVRRKANPPSPISVITDGGYYCSTCGHRLMECDCLPPEAAYEIGCACGGQVQPEVKNADLMLLSQGEACSCTSSKVHIGCVGHCRESLERARAREKAQASR